MHQASAWPRFRVVVVLVGLIGLGSGCASTGRSTVASCPEELHPPEISEATALAQRAYPFTNLALQGGGVKGVAYAGTYQVLEAAGVANQLERVVGASAGSIAALLISLRYPGVELEQELLNLQFQRFEDGNTLANVFRVFRDYGFYKGDFALEWLRDQVAAKIPGQPRATFADLRDAGMRDLYVVVTDLNRTRSKIFSAETTPGHEVALAVRMSMSIPLFFASIQEDDSVFVDGGVMWNYAIQLFDGDSEKYPCPAARELPEELPQVNPCTMGAFLHDPKSQGERLPIHGLGEYARALFDALLDSQVNLILFDRTIQARSAAVDDLGIPTTDFDITTRQKCDLIREGAKAAHEFLAGWRSGHLEDALRAQDGRVAIEGPPP